MKLSRLAILIAFGVVASASAAPEFMPGELLVKYRAGSLLSALAVNASIGAKVIEVSPYSGVYRLRLPRNVSVASAAAELSSRPDVEYAEPNFIARATATPNDTYYNNSIMWGLFKVQAGAAWDITQGSSAVRVAVLDTGADTSHPDLSGKVVLQWDFAYDDSVPEDTNGHGTHTAGTVGARTNNGVGVASIGWNTSLMIGKVLNNSGSGAYSDIADGIYWAAANGAKVINMSLGGSGGSSTLLNAVNSAWSSGLVIVAAAGNNGNTAPSYPAYYANCIAVAATDSSDRRASFSNYGSWVDCAAPGVNIASTYPGNSYVYMSGTSMASPNVAGLAALVWSTGYGYSNSSVRSRITSTGDLVTSGFGSYPTRRINAYNAVR